ncbi:putative flippase GtrA (transmembrane translocase of bactoprenol-linked glucose) [Prauserella aidingensis]|uniref:GtrA family protein n=1 Tax=Prauserella aidingensis TaxID=387890 RepID=UPI0020A3B5B2|nr:GtrA family protein [Prauserella aidingensis]MCP2252144.1 putative flippase GtrA (transmembrane translocase of bactoprenol-linked glucose) [Prauserella aidingensis]
MSCVRSRTRATAPEPAVRTGSGHLPELVRHLPLYVLGGAISTGLQALLFLLLRDPLTPAAANPVAIGVSTVLNTEFHRRITFRDVTGPRTRRHVQSAGTFLFYACAGTAALGLLHLLADDPSPMTETAVLVATSLVGGILRFLVLRSWVFVWSRDAGTAR